MVIHQPQDSHPSFQGWSPSTLIHHPHWVMLTKSCCCNNIVFVKILSDSTWGGRSRSWLSQQQKQPWPDVKTSHPWNFDGCLEDVWRSLIRVYRLCGWYLKVGQFLLVFKGFYKMLGKKWNVRSGQEREGQDRSGKVGNSWDKISQLCYARPGHIG